MVEYTVDSRCVEIYFDDVPSEKIRETMKICGWRWNGKKSCWYNWKNDENMEMAKSLCKAVNPPEENPLNSLPECEISVDDLIIRTNSFYCNANHDVEDVAGVLEVIDRMGNFHKRSIAMAYCQDCDIYYMLEETYVKLKKQGIIFGQIMTRKEYKTRGRFSLDASGWREKSPLKLWGYSTSKTDALTTNQRQAILAGIIERGVLTRDRVLSYLDFFVRLSSNEDSISCWQEDRKFVETYKLEQLRKILLKL